jgi:general secretion pathway protein D
MRIAADETTNSLVIIANNEDFRVVDSVIKKLDIERKQVFVDCVIMELASEDTVELGLAAHLPMQPGRESVGFVGGQFNATSVGLSPDQLSGLAAGVFGPSVEVPLGDGNVFPIPAFGIVLNALKADSSVDIISSPNVTTLDNQEAKIVVGRKIPFPTQSGLSNFGAPVTTFQREDVAITLQVTPRINSQDFVTLEVKLEVSEIEEDSQGLDVQQAGFITSKRELETTVLVQDNQTLVLGGLVGTTDTRVETKLPILGDIPLLGSFFRGSRSTERKTNLMVFLTPHIIDDEDDMREVQKVKEAQRQEFLRRFYGRSRDAYFEEIRRLLRYSMNYVEEPSVFRGPTTLSTDLTLDGVPLTEESRATIEGTLESRGTLDPGADAGTLPEGEVEILERPAGPVEEG